MEKVLLVALVVLAILGISFAVNCGLALLIVWTVSGLFHYALPFWPTVGGLYVLAGISFYFRGPSQS